jgi:hypothetical protein
MELHPSSATSTGGRYEPPGLVWRDDSWAKFWDALPGSRWAPLGEADGPYRGRLGWSAATLGSSVTELMHTPSPTTLILTAIASLALMMVAQADSRQLEEARESMHRSGDAREGRSAA